jgi:uncharacterized membrane protein SpoIIM required for sporulation
VIIDLARFMDSERACWSELEKVLNEMERHPGRRMTLEEVRRFQYLYDRTSADLARLMTFAAEPGTRRYLESLVARAYAEIHEVRERPYRLAPLQWFLGTFPRTFRRHVGAFWVALAVTLLGGVFGGFAVLLDPEAKESLLPEMFASHLGDPAERVAREEAEAGPGSVDHMTAFSAQLMWNNIKVSINALALGMTYGLGTLIVLFYNGIILGLVVLDYVAAGQTTFLLGWLLPHGSIELPAILIAGQGGLVFAGALIGWGSRLTLRERMRLVAPDMVTLIGGVAVLLVWAGLIEAFFSQYHEPVIPYALKIAFGGMELAVLIVFLWRSGAGRGEAPAGRRGR